MTPSVRFDDWVWNPNTLELRNGSHVVTLEPRVAKLFEYMVAHPGELLSRDHLVDAAWDGRVVSDEAVRSAVFNLRQALAVGGADNYIRTVHKKGYVASFPPPVVVNLESPKEPATAPLSNTTADAAGVTTVPLVHIDASTTRVAKSPLRLATLGIIAATVLVAAGLMRIAAWWSSEPAPQHTEVRAQAPATIAVLPFISVSEAADNQLLADGLTEELFGTLERYRELRVTARSSAFQFKEDERDARVLGERLGVRYVVEGEVRRNADTVQVQAKLVDSATGAQLWTETYDRAVADWFALQQDIAMDVAQALQRVLRLEGEAIARPDRVVNEEAQRELLRARELLITRSVADAEKAIEHLQRALTLDPNYSLAYARLADAILIQAESTTGIKAARPVVAPLLDKALALDPGLGEAYALRSRLTDDAAEAERDLRRGLELNPSYARGYEMLANLQFAVPQQMDMANDSIDTAIALDPLTPGNLHAKATFMMMRGNYPEAIDLDSHALELNPEFRAALAQLSFMSGVEGNFADAVYYAERALALDPRTVQLREMLILAYLAVGELDSVRVLNDPPTLYGQLALGESEGDMTQAADDLYSGRLSALGIMQPEAVSQIILHQALADMDFSRALALLSTVLPISDGLPPNTIAWTLVAYANLKQLLDASGNTEDASRLQEQMETLMSSFEARFPRHALVHNQVRSILLAHAGREEDACAALESAYSPVPRLLWWAVLGNPAFDNMRSAPCFVKLRARIDAHVALEREAIEEMRRAGKIPDRAGTQRKREDTTPS